MLLRLCFVVLILPTVCFSQQIVDSCFLSINPGRYDGNADIQNTCWKCYPKSTASDMLEWDPINSNWKGKLPDNTSLDLPPPPGPCLQRAVWMGSPGWTWEGEGVSFRLDKAFERGKTYSFSFTYAADGEFSEGGFAPVIITNTNYHLTYKSVIVDTLPRVFNSWETHEFTFVATDEQDGHNWLSLLAYDGSGTLLSNCSKPSPFKSRFFPPEAELCDGDQIEIEVAAGEEIVQVWNDGSDGSSLSVNAPGTYWVEASYYNCLQQDTIVVAGRDCEVRLEMPNVFTPNDDKLNSTFIPMKTNFVKHGTLTIFNRWGEHVFRGDVFLGWDGDGASTGMYYYKVDFNDEKNLRHQRNGFVQLLL